jgi:hypothetical protein
VLPFQLHDLTKLTQFGVGGIVLTKLELFVAYLDSLFCAVVPMIAPEG